MDDHPQQANEVNEGWPVEEPVVLDAPGVHNAIASIVMVYGQALDRLRGRYRMAVRELTSTTQTLMRTKSALAMAEDRANKATALADEKIAALEKRLADMSSDKQSNAELERKITEALGKRRLEEAHDKLEQLKGDIEKSRSVAAGRPAVQTSPHDRQDEAGESGEERVGQAAQQAEPHRGASEEASGTGGVLQASPGQEVRDEDDIPF